LVSNSQKSTGSQALGWFFHAKGTNDDLWKAMDSPAARQILIYNLGSAIQAGKISIQNLNVGNIEPMDFSELTNFDYSGMRTNFKSTMQGLGWPKLTRKVVLVDGLKNGTVETAPLAQG
jgi:hypothetical protein